MSEKIFICRQDRSCQPWKAVVMEAKIGKGFVWYRPFRWSGAEWPFAAVSQLGLLAGLGRADRAELHVHCKHWKVLALNYYYYYYIYLFLAVLGLHCCTWALSSCGEWGLLFVVLRGLLIASLGMQASVVVARGLSSCGSWALEHRLSSCVPVASWTRAGTCVPCIGRRILNHCATREPI